MLDAGHDLVGRAVVLALGRPHARGGHHRAEVRILAAALRVRPEAKSFGSPTCSDWVFVRDADAIKCGPGTSRRSHTADEYVDLPEVTAARAFYARLAKEYLG